MDIRDPRASPSSNTIPYAYSTIVHYSILYTIVCSTTTTTRVAKLNVL